MKTLKKLFICCIVLLILTTPPIFAKLVNENKHLSPLKSPLNDFGNNSLGKIRAIHYPMYYKYSKFHGMTVEYFPPVDNPGYDYYFCEVDDKVLMNFSLTIEHRLNEMVPFFFTRYTGIELWIGGHEYDYFRIENKTLCDSEGFITYYVNLSEEDHIVPLETNGENVTLQFWLFVKPVVSNFKFIHLIMEIIPDLGVRIGPITINIYPVQC